MSTPARKAMDTPPAAACDFEHNDGSADAQLRDKRIGAKAVEECVQADLDPNQ